MEQRPEAVHGDRGIGMKAVFYNIKKHLVILKMFTKNYLISQMEYKCSFFTYLIVETIVLLSKLLYVGVTYNTGITVNGLKPEEILLFNGTFFIVSGVYGGFFMLNFSNFRTKVKNGDLDLLMVKPVSLQFMCTLSTVEFAVLIPNVGTGIVMVCYVWNVCQLQVSVFNILGYLFLILCGIVIVYNILFLPQLLSFKLIETNSLFKITSSLSNFNMMPMHIYPEIMKRIGIFIFPIFVVTNFPSMFILGKLNIWYVLWSPVAAILLTVPVRLLWKKSVKGYSSAMN